MEADIDFDVITHLGFIRNIDVASRGVFFVRVTLFYGDNDQRITPIGLFSAPSRLDSFVGDQRVPPPPFLNVCHIDNEDQTFRCRSFVIRYRDEKHELNDGAHWRLTIPGVDLSQWRGSRELLDVANTCEYDVEPSVRQLGGLLFEDTLQLQFELFHAPLLEGPSGTNMLFDIANLVPKNPEFEIVSSQRIEIQNHGWAGFHEYFPIRFERSNSVELDVMVHCGITDIKYKNISFSVLPMSERSLTLLKESNNMSSSSGHRHDSERYHEPVVELNGVGSSAIQEHKIDVSQLNDAQQQEDYPAGIGIWYTNSNVNLSESSPGTSSQPIKSHALIESYLSPPIPITSEESLSTPQKAPESSFENVVFDTPSPGQYVDVDGLPTTGKKRTSYQPPRKPFTPGLDGKHKTNTMPNLAVHQDGEDGRSGHSSMVELEGVILSDDLTSSPMGNIATKTPVSRKSYQPGRKSFTPGAKTEVPPKSLFSKKLNSPERVSSDPRLIRMLQSEENLPIESFDEDDFTKRQAKTVQTNYSLDDSFDTLSGEMATDAELSDSQIQSLSTPHPLPLPPHVAMENEKDDVANIISGMEKIDIHVPLIHTQTPSPPNGQHLHSGWRPAVVPIILRHQITTVVQRQTVTPKSQPSGTIGDNAGSSQANRNGTPNTSDTDRYPSPMHQSNLNSKEQPHGQRHVSPANNSTTEKNVSMGHTHHLGGSEQSFVYSYGYAFTREEAVASVSCEKACGVYNKNRRLITACGVELDDALSLICSYFGPLVANQNRLNSGMAWILKLLNSNKQNASLVSSSFGLKDGMNILSTDLIADIMRAESISTLKIILQNYINNSSLDKCAGIWKQLFVALPKVMPNVLKSLQNRYIQIIRSFWKEQIMVHTCRDTNMTKVHPLEASAAQLLEAMLKIEQEHGYLVVRHLPHHPSSETLQMTASNIDTLSPAKQGNVVAETPEIDQLLLDAAELLSPPLVMESHYHGKKACHRASGDSSSGVRTSPHFFLPARGMRLFDPAVHKLPSRLPTIVVQQYISNRRLNNTPAHLAMLKPKEGILRGGALIGVEPTPLSLAMSHGSDGNHINSKKTATTEEIQSVKVSLRGEFVDEDEGVVSYTGVTSSGVVKEDPKATTNSEFHPEDSHPYLMDTCHEDVDITGKPSAKVKGPHIVFLQHGFKGTAYDMRLIRNAITAMFPDNTQVYAAESNETNSEDSIETLGQRLAIEIHHYIKSREPKMLKDPSYGRVSFIGHSVGGLIIRKSLESELLKPLLPKLHLYMSLASPHLGTLYADSQLVSTGMWALFKLQKAAVLKELSLDDVGRDDMTKSLLYRLSENGVFMYFKWVVFVSSPKDQYVPQYSARVQVSSKAVADARTGPAIVSMAANVMAQTDPSRLFRVSVDNNTGTKYNVNTMIGRTAHICYLDNPIVVEQLIYTLSPFLL